MKVVVNGENFNNKEMVIFVEKGENGPIVRYTHYKQTKTLPVEWVSIKHPNLTRDDSLILIVKGDHCGKFVRRIHHKYENGQSQAIPILRVVNCQANTPEVLTDEDIELDMSFLCLAAESTKERKAGDGLMKSL